MCSYAHIKFLSQFRIVHFCVELLHQFLTLGVRQQTTVILVSLLEFLPKKPMVLADKICDTTRARRHNELLFI